VGIGTSSAGVGTDGEPGFATVNGTSVAAASVAGAAALLAQARPALDAESLRGLLVQYARPAGRLPPTEQGAGRLDVGASAAGEVMTRPTSLSFGRGVSTRTLTIRNVSSRSLTVDVSAGASEPARVTLAPRHLVLRRGARARIRVSVHALPAPRTKLIAGAIQVVAAGGPPARVAWAVDRGGSTASLLSRVHLRDRTFAPSDRNPALLDLQVGGLSTAPALEVTPAARLEIVLYSRAGNRIGLLARQRDLLPGAYRFGITGRGPTGARLPPGGYELRIAAWPTVPGRPSRKIVAFRIE
jgi:hypothetical protein